MVAAVANLGRVESVVGALTDSTEELLGLRPGLLYHIVVDVRIFGWKQIRKFMKNKDAGVKSDVN